jgi:hypothetical protein
VLLFLDVVHLVQHQEDRNSQVRRQHLDLPGRLDTLPGSTTTSVASTDAAVPGSARCPPPSHDDHLSRRTLTCFCGMSTVDSGRCSRAALLDGAEHEVLDAVDRR